MIGHTKAQILRGFDWGYGGNPYRGRPKVIKSVKDDLLPHIKNDCFEEKLIPWLPEDKPQKSHFDHLKMRYVLCSQTMIL